MVEDPEGAGVGLASNCTGRLPPLLPLLPLLLPLLRWFLDTAPVSLSLLLLLLLSRLPRNEL